MNKELTVGELQKKLALLPANLYIRHYCSPQEINAIRDCRLVVADEIREEDDAIPRPLFACIY